MASKEKQDETISGKLIIFRNQKIGKCSEGVVVFEGLFENLKVAVKRINIDYATNEAELLRSSNSHENIVRYYGSEMNSNFVFIVMELCAGTLGDLVDGNYKGPTVGNNNEVLRQIAIGLEYLHAKKIIHRDLKPQNILISIPDATVPPRMKLADFGLSKRKMSDFSMTKTNNVGTVGWSAPEMFDPNATRCNSSADIFSLGCVFGYVLTDGYHPFGEGVMRIANILYGKLDWKEERRISDEELKQLIQKMIVRDPRRRPDIKTILEHRYLTLLPLASSPQAGTSNFPFGGDARVARQQESFSQINISDSITPARKDDRIEQDPKESKTDKPTKVYDRAFLYGLENNPASQIKPQGLPILDFIRETNAGKTKPSKASGDARKKELAGNQGAASSTQDVPEEPDPVEELVPYIGDTLNELTSKSELNKKLVHKIRTLNIETERGLSRVVELVFEKAISEPIVSSMYAKICKALATTMAVPSASNPSKKTHFGHLLLTRCQRECEKISTGKNEEEKKLNEHQLENLADKNRMLSVRTTKFIQELFKLNVLPAKIMHLCITRLLNSPDNEVALECICFLMTNIGKALESSTKKKEVMNEYFSQLDGIVNRRIVSDRITLKIQKVMELRNNKWKPSPSGPLPLPPVTLTPYLQVQPEYARMQLKLRAFSKATLKGNASVTEDDMKSKVKSVLDELFANESLEIAVLDLEGWLHPSTVEQFVNQCVVFVLERNRTERRATGTLFKEMIKRELFNFANIANGFNKLLLGAEGLIVDILWEYLAEIVEPMFEGGVVNFIFLGQLSSPLGSYATKFVAAILRELVKAQGGAAGAERIWSMSNVSLASVLPPGVDPDAFVSQHEDLDFLVKAPSSPYLEFQRSLQDYLEKTSELTNNDVCKWIDSQKQLNRHHPAFIRALVTAVSESSIDGHGIESKLIRNTFKERTEVLRRYVSNLPDRELQLLFAVQALVTQRQHPKGLIQGIFEALYDSNVVSEEGFELWVASDDPAEREGKAVAMKSIAPFLTWLKETDAESDQDSDVDPITFVNYKTIKQDERECKIDVLQSVSVVRHPIPPGPLGVNQPLAMAGAGQHTGPMQGQPTQGNNQFYNRAPLRPNNMTRPPMGSNASTHPPNPAPVMPYPGQPLSQPVVVFINDQYNQQPQLFQNPYQYYQTPGNMPTGSYQPRAAQQPYANYRQPAPSAAPYMGSPAVYYPQRLQQAHQQAPQPVPMGPVSVPGVPPMSQSRESTGSSRRVRTSAIRLVDPNTNRDVISGEYVSPPVVPVTNSAP